MPADVRADASAAPDTAAVGAPRVTVRDLLPVALLAAIGFTVSLLIAELSFEEGQHAAPAKGAILVGSVIAACAAAVLLRWNARKARDPDMNRDGVVDSDLDVIGG